MSYTKKILREQARTKGIVRPAFGPPYELTHAPRSTNDRLPFVAPYPKDDPFRYSGREVWVDIRGIVEEKE